MHRSLATGILLFSFVAISSVIAQDKPYSKWSRKEAQKILSDSPWTKRMTLAQQVTDVYRGSPDAGGAMGNPRETVDGPRGYGMARDSGVAGDKELYHAYVVSLFSALPVRQAYVRLLQFKNGYDRMSADQKQASDEKYAALLNADMSEKIIVSVEFSSNDRNLNIEVNQRLRQATAELLRQSAYLITERVGRVALETYEPPASGETSARLIFPRTLNGEPVVRPGDREFKLEFFVPGTDHKVYIVWNIKDLRRNGIAQF